MAMRRVARNDARDRRTTSEVTPWRNSLNSWTSVVSRAFFFEDFDVIGDGRGETDQLGLLNQSLASPKVIGDHPLGYAGIAGDGTDPNCGLSAGVNGCNCRFHDALPSSVINVTVIHRVVHILHRSLFMHCDRGRTQLEPSNDGGPLDT